MGELSQPSAVEERRNPVMDGAGKGAALLVILAIVFAMRWPFLGNPMIHVDEQFYLLAGQRLIEGWVPYADLWDRKPIGLFLLFGAIRLLGGEGIVQYQLMATLFAGGTAWVIYLIALRGVSAPAAFAAALIYAALLAPLNGAGGQSPVFYNLFVAAAALLVLRAGEADSPAAANRLGTWAMLSMGVAMQFKYTAVFEGLFLGCWLLADAWRRGASIRTIAAISLLFAGAALLPTVAAAAGFAALGALDSFLWANFISIFERTRAPQEFEREALGHTLRMLIFALLGAAAALIIAWTGRARADRGFLTLWLAFAAAGFFAIGNYYDHYALPLLVPLAVLLSRLFAVRFAGPALFALVFIQAGLYGYYRYPPTSVSQTVAAAMTARLKPVADAGECIFVADTPLVLYLTTGACAPWRYSFPFHLIDGTESHSGDHDQPGALQRILDARPGAIVTGSPPFPPVVQRANMALLKNRLSGDYVFAGNYPHGFRSYTIWIRGDLTQRAKPRTP